MPQPDCFSTVESVRAITFFAVILPLATIGSSVLFLTPRLGLAGGALTGLYPAALFLAIFAYARARAKALGYQVSDDAFVVLEHGRPVRVIPRKRVRSFNFSWYPPLVRFVLDDGGVYTPGYLGERTRTAVVASLERHGFPRG